MNKLMNVKEMQNHDYIRVIQHMYLNNLLYISIYWINVYIRTKSEINSFFHIFQITVNTNIW